MFTPYDWQEGISHRAQFCLSRLESGTPVLAISLEEGILALTVRRQARKLYEVYNRLMFSAIGQQSDVESIRVAAIEFAHQEGFQRSENDVTIQRVVATLSQPLKKAFADFSSAPFVARSLLAEVGSTPADDTYYILDYDGDFSVRKSQAYLAGSDVAKEQIKSRLRELDGSKLKRKDAVLRLQEIWAAAVDPEGGSDFASLTASLTPEVALLSRSQEFDRRFTLLAND